MRRVWGGGGGDSVHVQFLVLVTKLYTGPYRLVVFGVVCGTTNRGTFHAALLHVCIYKKEKRSLR